MTQAVHFKLEGRPLCANRANFKTTTDRREVTCEKCKAKATQIYERVLRRG